MGRPLAELGRHDRPFGPAVGCDVGVAGDEGAVGPVDPLLHQQLVGPAQGPGHRRHRIVAPAGLDLHRLLGGPGQPAGALHRGLHHPREPQRGQGGTEIGAGVHQGGPGGGHPAPVGQQGERRLVDQGGHRRRVGLRQPVALGQPGAVDRGQGQHGGVGAGQQHASRREQGLVRQGQHQPLGLGPHLVGAEGHHPVQGPGAAGPVAAVAHGAQHRHPPGRQQAGHLEAGGAVGSDQHGRRQPGPPAGHRASGHRVSGHRASSSRAMAAVAWRATSHSRAASTLRGPPRPARAHHLSRAARSSKNHSTGSSGRG